MVKSFSSAPVTPLRAPESLPPCPASSTTVRKPRGPARCPHTSRVLPPPPGPAHDTISKAAAAITSFIPSPKPRHAPLAIADCSPLLRICREQ
jgi:hypothetical protein